MPDLIPSPLTQLSVKNSPPTVSAVSPPAKSECQQVLGMPVHLLADYLGWLTQCLAAGMGAHVVTLNSEMVMLAEANPELSTVIRKADLIVPDGAGIVLYFKLYGRNVQRCPGIELAEALLISAATTSPPAKVFFYGSNPEVLAAVKDKWLRQLPSLNLVGVQDGYHAPEEELDIITRLAELQPQIIFVGLGVPRQEYWIARNRQVCPHAIWVGVGGSFDVWGGKKNRAPRWLRDNNLEWVYRLYQEPWRWKRMLALPKFAWRALLSRIFNPKAVG